MAIEPREEWQKFDLNLNEDGRYDPEYLREFFISNIVQRVVGLLEAIDEVSGNPVRLKATASGLLKVSSVPPIRDIYEVYKQSIPAGGQVVITFTEPVSLVEIWTYGATLLIEKSTDGTTYGGQVEIPSGAYWKFESTTKSLRITNTDTVNVQDVQVVGWR